MTYKFQVVENSDRFHVSINSVPVVTLLFATDGGVGVSKAFAQMNADAAAYKLAVDYQRAGHIIKLLRQEIK